MAPTGGSNHGTLLALLFHSYWLWVPCSACLRATSYHRVVQRSDLRSYAREIFRKLFNHCGRISTICSLCRTTFDNILWKVKSGAGMPEFWATSTMAVL